MSHKRQPEVECFPFWRGFASYHGQEDKSFYVCDSTLQTRLRQNAPKREKYNFRLTSVAQKRLCLRSLIITILDSGDSDTFNVTSDGITVERDSQSRLLNAYGSPINAKETERNQTDEIYFYCTKELLRLDSYITCTIREF